MSHDLKSYALSDIAASADAIDRLAALMLADPANESTAVLSVAISALAQRIGWAADLTRESGCMRGGAERWMLAAGYFREIGSAETGKVNG